MTLTITQHEPTLKGLEDMLSNPTWFIEACILANNCTKAHLMRLIGRKTKLLGESVKTAKEDRTMVHTKILYLAPHDLSGVNVCPSAKTCIKGCLNTAGKGELSSVQIARIRKTNQLMAAPKAFVALLIKEIDKHVADCTKKGVEASIRFNGTSDINWALIWQYVTKLGAHAYEYTKRLSLLKNHMEGVHLTYSFQGTQSPKLINSILAQGINVAVVFGLKPSEKMQDKYQGWDVIDGDTTDNRFLDQPFHVVGLRAKGRARKAKGKFVVR